MNNNNDNNIEFHIPIEIEQYERKIFDLKQLIDLSKALNSTLDYNNLIESILLSCMGQIQVEKAGIFLKKGIGHENYFLHRNYKGFDVDHSMEFELDVDSKLLRYFENVIECYSLDDLRKAVGKDQSLTILEQLNPCQIVPLISKGLLNGIIILGERISGDDFAESEKEFLVNIASLAGIAIHNAALYEMATTDMMTQLKMHHFFKTILLEEIERSNRMERPFSLIMADIDHFKGFNDTYGHQAGDVVLINVARLIKESIRQIDTAARYGGEEFTVILPGVKEEGAKNVAERIRSSIEKEVVSYNDLKLTLTISLGVTEFLPKKDKRIEYIIERVDTAMYQSKKNGRNRVTVL